MSSAGLRGVTLLVAVTVFAVAVPLAVGASHSAHRSAVPPGNPVAGKALFQQFCGKCHVMTAAGSKGTIGPNLDKDRIGYTGVVSAVIQGVGGIQAEYLLRALTFAQIYDVAKFVVVDRPGGTNGKLSG